MTDLPALDPGGWAPYLDPGERLLWEGRPATGLRLRARDVGPSFVGLIFIGFGLVWTAQAGAEPGGPAFLPYVGVLPILAGLQMAVGRYFWDSFRRARTRYALTDRRALIATSHLGRRMRALPVRPGMEIEFRPGAESTIVLARETLLGQRHPVRGKGRTRGNLDDLGFEFIPDGDRVMHLIRAVQRARGREAAQP